MTEILSGENIPKPYNIIKITIWVNPVTTRMRFGGKIKRIVGEPSTIGVMSSHGVTFPRKLRCPLKNVAWKIPFLGVVSFRGCRF